MFGGGTSGNANIFGGGGGGGSSGAANIFGGGNRGGTTGGTGGGSANIFGGGGGGGQTGNIFGGGQQTGQQGGMFGGGGQQGQTGGIFGGQQNTQQQQNAFGKTGQQQGNIFGGGGQQQQTGGIFGGQQGGLFGGGQQQQGGMFGGGGGQGQLFTGGGQQPQQGMMNLGGMGANLMNFPHDQQQQFMKLLTPQYIRQLILNCRKQLDIKRLDYIQLSHDNPLKGEKIAKLATTYNIKKPLLHVEKQTKEHLTTPLKQLKETNAKLEKMSADLGEKVFEKLQRYKERLVVSVGQGKLVEQVKKQVEEIEGQVNNFLKPIFNAHLNRSNYSFPDPDPFCITIAEKLLRNITSLDNKMDQLLACHAEPSQETLDTAQVIEQLVEYYHNVAITLRQFSARYNRVKQRVIEKNRLGSPQEALRRLNEKAGAAVSKEMEAYQLVKEIEGLLQKRERRMSEGMNP